MEGVVDDGKGTPLCASVGRSRMGGLGPYITDCETLLSQIKHEEKQLVLKRRWLMGLPLSKSAEKHCEGPKFIMEKTLPESLLREDDVFYETVKTHVEEAFENHDSEAGCSVIPENFKSLDLHETIKCLHSHLNDLTNKGLYHFAMVIAGGSVKIDKTRWRMRKVIKESLAKVIRSHWNNQQKSEMCKQLYQLMSDPRSFRGNCPTILVPQSNSQRTVAIKILDRLEDFPSQVLIAMHKKLKQAPLEVPRLQTSKCGRSRVQMVTRVRKACKKMLSKPDMSERLPDPLAKAMAVAVLSLKLLPRFKDILSTDFCQFSPEIKTLQDEIVKAIWLLKTKVRFHELKKLQNLLDPDARVPNGGLRNAVLKMFTEYLFQCCELDVIPNSLLEALSVINRNSRTAPNAFFSKSDAEADVEHVLDVSAQMKQIVWDFLPENGYHKDFSNAYIEEMQDSDDDDDDVNVFDDSDDGDKKCFQGEISSGPGSYTHLEGFGDSVAVDSRCRPIRNIETTAFNARKILNSAMKSEPDSCLEVDSIFSHCTASTIIPCNFNLSEGKIGMDVDQDEQVIDFSSPKMRNDGVSPPLINRRNSFQRNKTGSDDMKDHKENTVSREDTYQNQYLAIQEVCDQTSMAAYDLVGFVLAGLAQAESSDLDLRGSFYLNRGHSTNEDRLVSNNKHAILEDDVKASIISGAVKKYAPFLQHSVMGRLKEIMDR